MPKMLTNEGATRLAGKVRQQASQVHADNNYFLTRTIITSTRIIVLYLYCIL